MRSEIRIAGLGGQGVILCGMIIGKAASIFDGKHATLIQAFGPEARGSAASAQVTLSDRPIGYPYVRRPDVLVTLSPDAFSTFAPSLKEGGLLLYESELVSPKEGLPDGIKTLGVPATRLAEELGRRLVMNIVMVGFFTATTQLISFEAAKKAVLDSVPRGTEELNHKAFEAGYAYGQKLLAPEGSHV